MFNDKKNSALAEVKKLVKIQSADADSNPFHHEAARSLLALHRKLDRETTLEELSRRLTHDLACAGPAMLDMKLVQQAQVLDAAFNYLMTDGATTQCSEAKLYQSAFQAQKLFRQSLQLLDQRNREKPFNRTIKRTDKTRTVSPDAVFHDPFSDESISHDPPAHDPLSGEVTPL
jgi:hypothetical protein